MYYFTFSRMIKNFNFSYGTCISICNFSSTSSCHVNRIELLHLITTKNIRRWDFDSVLFLSISRGLSANLSIQEVD